MTRKLFLLPSLLLNLCLLALLLVLVTRFGGINYIITKVRFDNTHTAMSISRAEHFNHLPHTSEDILFIGDSLTQQVEWSELFNRVDIKNRGIAGNKTFQILERLQPLLEQSPSKIFLMVGINDLAYRNVEPTAQDFQKIIDRITSQSPHTQLYIQSILPVNNSIRQTGIRNENILNLNTMIQTYIKEKPYITWVALHREFVDEKGQLKQAYTYDGLHLNAAGYSVWKESLLPFITK